jgi:hypothetical protein
MIQSKILEYAKKHIEVTAEENHIQGVFISDNKTLFLEMVTGKSYELSQKELEYQAEEYLLSEFEDLKN